MKGGRGRERKGRQMGKEILSNNWHKIYYTANIQCTSF